ncbi:MAG: hypothetical protein J5I98_22800 [Phaeodactylibacter sp.]|nr:hypothetical protein [Phaeodactylibacter sp.]
MNPSDYLWRLVHLMDKSEARHFRLAARIHNGKKNGGKKKYEYLYDEIKSVELAEDYSEDAIRKKLDKEDKVPKGSFAVTKNYLTDNLLRALRYLNESGSVEGKIRVLLDEAQLLFGRGILYKSAKQLARAKKLARKYQCFPLLAEILRLEVKQQVSTMSRLEKPFQSISRLYEEQDAAVKSLAQETEYNRLMNQAFVLYHTRNTLLGEEGIRLLETLRQDPALKKPERFLSFRSELLYHHAWGLIHTVENINPKLIFFHYRKTLEVWDKHPIFKEEYTRSYKLYLFNFLSTCHSQKDYSSFEAILGKTQEMESRTIFDRSRDFFNTCQYKLLFLTNAGKAEAAQNLAREVEEKILLYGKLRYPLPKEKLLSLYYNISVMLFVTGHYQSALHWTDKIRKELRKTAARLDLKYFTRILQLLILFESGQDDQLDYKEPYVKRLLKGQDMYSGFDAMVLKYLRKLCKYRYTRDEKELFRALLQEIEDSEAQYRKIRGREEVKLWAQSHLEGKKMIDLIRENFQAKKGGQQ